MGVGLLFMLIILLSVLSTKYINELKADTENILVANYNSIEYCQNMLMELEKPTDNNLEKFELNLQLQEKNITEIGEPALTSEIRNQFNFLKLNRNDTVRTGEIKGRIFRLMEMNRQAILRKSEVARVTAENAVFWIAVSGTLCFLIAFVLLFNLPSSIADPIQELTKSIGQIAAKHYSERVHFEDHSEFGQLARSFNTMAEKLEEYNDSNLARLMMEKKRIETIINNMQDPVFGLDENLKIIFANEEATKISGLDAKDLIGRMAQELSVHNDLIRSLIKDLTAGNAESGDAPSTIKIFSGNKESYFEKETHSIWITPTGETESILVGHVIFLHNVTHFKELDYARTHFIANVSHEFKTPISSIKLSLQLLENKQIGNLNQEQQNLISSIQDDVNRLLRITSELLNMTQVESGNIQLSMLPADVREIALYAIQATQAQAHQKQVSIRTDIPKYLPHILADHEKTAWVVTNLLSNAIRYSHDQSDVFLSIAEEGNQVRITVRDTGQGIAPQYKDKIFDRYFRIPGSNKEGTGLGLSISKEFIEAQNGSIAVESDYGSGSTFTIRLNKA